MHYQEKAMFSVSEILQLRKRKQRRKRHLTIANKPLQFLLIERKNEFWRKTYLKAWTQFVGEAFYAYQRDLRADRAKSQKRQNKTNVQT